MMKKFQANGVILVDCWAQTNELRLPKNKDLYLRIKQFLEERIDYECIVSTIDDLDPMLKELPGKRIHAYSWEELQELGLTTGNWIIAGQAWGICFHRCKLGVEYFIEKNYPSLNLFSNPMIVDYDHTQDIELTNSTFENDTNANWSYQRPVDLWAVNVPGRSPVQILV